MNLKSWRNKQQESGADASPIVALRSEMNRLFESFFREPFGVQDWPFWGAGQWSPAVDVSENDTELSVTGLPHRAKR